MAVRTEADPLGEGQLYSVGGKLDERIGLPQLLRARDELTKLGHGVLDGGVYDDQHGHNAQLRIEPPLSTEETKAVVQAIGLHLQQQGPSADRLH